MLVWISSEQSSNQNEIPFLIVAPNIKTEKLSIAKASPDTATTHQEH